MAGQIAKAVGPSDPTTARFIAGDAIRAVAATGVVLLHLAGTSLRAGEGNPPSGTNSYHQLGAARPLVMLASGTVWLFFALSGYLLARPFMRSLIRGEALPPVGRCLRNRVLRIVPAFDYLALPLCASVAALSLRRRVGRWARIMLVGGLLLAAWWLLVHVSRHAGRSTLARESIQASMFAFLPGTLLALLEVTPLPGVIPRALAPALAAIAAVVAGLLYWNITYHGGDSGPLGSFTQWNVALFLTIAAPLLMQWGCGRCWFLLDNPLMRWVGTRSYSLYLYHLFVISLLTPTITSFAIPATSFDVMAPVVLLVTLSASEVSYRLVEAPAMRLRTRWRSQEPLLAAVMSA